MSRSGYSDDCEPWNQIRWRGAVRSALRGRKGQKFLREMAAAIEALPGRKLIARELEQEGAVCALGAVGKARGVDMTTLDPHNREVVAATFGIPHALACEIFYMNDEWVFRESPEDRFSRMLEWIRSEIRPATHQN